MLDGEEDFEKIMAFVLYDLYGHAISQELLPRGDEHLEFLEDIFLVILTIY